MTRGRLAARLAIVAGAVLLGGCVYYNGMYNTNRLAKSARKAERDGRQFQAQSLWGQVVTRADSLVARHPRSKYADQAAVLRGLALARLNQCPEAIGPLGRVSAVELSTDFAEEAALALGRCQLELGDAGQADLAFVRVLNSADETRRKEARFRHARALRLTGRYDEALEVLGEHPDPRARQDRLLSLAGAGRTQEALAFADSILALNDSTFAWDSVLAVMGRRDPRSASSLVDRLGNDPRATPEIRARRLYEDAVRLAPADSAAGLARYEQASRVPGSTESGERARLRLLAVGLSAARTVEDLDPVADSLAKLVGRAGAAGAEAASLGAMVARVRQLSDSARPEVPQGDLRGFLAAEAARDTLRAAVLAAALFRRLADDWPASPYAPKALLAAQLLDSSDPDGTRNRLDSLYHDSPYLALLRGEEAPGYRALEDSLQAFAASAIPRAGPRARGRGVPGALPEDEGRRRRGLRPDDEDVPVSRPRPGARPAVEDTSKSGRGLEP